MGACVCFCAALCAVHFRFSRTLYHFSFSTVNNKTGARILNNIILAIYCIVFFSISTGDCCCSSKREVNKMIWWIGYCVVLSSRVRQSLNDAINATLSHWQSMMETRQNTNVYFEFRVEHYSPAQWRCMGDCADFFCWFVVMNLI